MIVLAICRKEMMRNGWSIHWGKSWLLLLFFLSSSYSTFPLGSIYVYWAFIINMANPGRFLVQSEPSAKAGLALGIKVVLHLSKWFLNKRSQFCTQILNLSSCFIVMLILLYRMKFKVWACWSSKVKTMSSYMHKKPLGKWVIFLWQNH